jgi:hypothetical protein
MKKKIHLSVDEVVSMANKKTKDFISELEREEQNERVESLDKIKNDIKGQKLQTKINKEKFIEEIKSGLGQKVKTNPNAIRIIKRPWYTKLGLFIKEIFTKF